MGVLTLDIVSAELGVKKTMKFEPGTMVYDVGRMVRDKLGIQGNANEYGLIRVDEVPSKSFWMENNRKLEYYLIRSGDTLEYKNKIRQLRVRTLDGSSVRTIAVDESQPASQLMITVCTKMGIANHEEFSLVRENPTNGFHENGQENGYRRNEGAVMNTIGRKKERQLQQLRAKLHTDEEINWVDPAKTLREQQIGEHEELTLRRKFFFSDTNVDTRDPAQLNQLYAQCREGVLSGVHPVSRDIAIKLAALQCYIEYGPFQEGIQKQLNSHELLPKEYAKAKEHEKNIAEEYKEIIYEDQASPKKKYCELCQSLPTYGVTFFLVKEKVHGKNKLIPRLLGINKESVMRVDEKSKAVMKEWPLEQVRRWAAAPKTFTLDFGDYKDGYYSVQTQDAEKIAQLIAGYIDIILKKKKIADHMGIEGDEGSTMLEDMVAPARATLIAHGEINARQPVDSRQPGSSALRSASGTPSALPHGAQYGAVSGVVTTQEMPHGQRVRYQNPRERAQRALIGTIEQTIRAVEEAEEEIMKPPQIDLPHFDLSNRRWRVEVEKEAVSDRLAAMGAATAEVVQLTAIPDDSADSRVGVAISTIGSNLPEMGRGVRELAGLMPDQHRAGDLIDATRRLMGAFGSFIDKVHPDHAEKRSNILSAASQVGETTHEVINTMREETAEDRAFHDQLTKRAKDVATNTASLVMHAKTISADCTEPALREQIIQSATQTAYATSELVACARVVAPTIEHPPSQQRLTDAAHNVSRTVETLLQESNTATQYSQSGNGPKNLQDIHAAARLVTESLHSLVDHIHASPRGQITRKTQQDYNYEEVVRSSNRVITRQHDPIRDSTNAIRHSQVLVEEYENEAANAAPGQRDKLLSAARNVAQATSNMISATQEAQSKPQEAEAQMALKTAAENLVQATSNAAADRVARQTVQHLEKSAKDTCTAATQTVTAINAAQRQIRNRHTVETLVVETTEAARYIPTVVTLIKESHGAKSPSEQFRAQSRLIHGTQELLPHASRLVEVSRQVVPEVEDRHAAESLHQNTLNLSSHLAELRVALNNAQQLNNGQQLDHVDELIDELDAELQQIPTAVRQGRIPAPADPQKAESALNDCTRSVLSTLTQLTSAAQGQDPQHLGASALEAAHSLRSFVRGVRNVAPNTANNVENMVLFARSAVGESGRVFNGVRNNASNEELRESLKKVAGSIDQTLSALPERVSLSAAVQRVRNADRATPPAAAQADVRLAASHLIEAASKLVAAIRADDRTQSAAVEAFVRDYVGFHATARAVAARKSPGTVQELQRQLANAQTAAIDVLERIRPATVDPQNLANTQALSAAVRLLADSVGQIVGHSSEVAPWLRECDNALHQIDTVRPVLTAADAPVNENSYYESLEAVTEQAKLLGAGLAGLAHCVKHNDTQQLVPTIRQAADAVCALAENTAQSAYLIGAGDAESVRGRAAPFDATRLGRALHVVKHVCENIEHGENTNDQLMNDASTVATHTSTIATVCRDAADRSQHVNVEKQFAHCAHGITNATSVLIASIRRVGTDASAQAHAETVKRAAELRAAAETLEAFVDRPEFTAGPATISAAGRSAQQPVLESARTMLDASAEMIRTTKNLFNQPTDAPTWQRIASNSRIVSESIKTLVGAIRDEAPGQAELEAAAQRLQQLTQEIDSASLAAAQQQLPPASGSEKLLHQQILNSAQSLRDKLPPFRDAAKSRAEQLGYGAREHLAAVEPMVNATIHAAALGYDAQAQAQLFDQCKTVVEAELQLMLAAKDAAGNPRAIEAHSDVDAWAQQVADASSELQRTVNFLDSQAGHMHGIIETINHSITISDQSKPAAADDTFPNIQTRLVQSLNEIKQIATDMPLAGADQLGSLSLQISEAYNRLTEDGRVAHSLLRNPTLAQRLKISMQKLGSATVETVKTAGQRRAYPHDERIGQQLHQDTETIVERVEEVLAALHEGSRGTQACINAANTVSGIIGDLDTTILFATSGSLNQPATPSHQGRQYDAREHRDTIAQTAKALVEDTKALVTGAASNQEQLAVAAQNAVRTIMVLSDAVRQGASALSSDSPESQVTVIHAVRDVAAALSNLIQATKNASGRNPQDPAMEHLKNSARSMVSNVSNLLKTIKSIEDKGQHGAYALEAAIHAIDFAVKQYDVGELRTDKHSTAEEVVRATRAVTEASRRATTSAQQFPHNQEHIIAAANLARQAVAELLQQTLSASAGAESAELRFRTVNAGRDVAMQVKELLTRLFAILRQPGDRNAEAAILTASKEVANSVNALAQCCDTLRTNSWPDGVPGIQDPEEVAENELLGAATSIEAAAEKLRHMRPRHVQHNPEQEIEFDVHILDAAKSIAGAVSTLVRAASAAQRELVALGRVDTKPRGQLHGNDYQWSEGLVSAARAVAAAVQQLCDAANGLVQGHATEEKLISAAKQVAAHTAALMVACRVRADPDSLGTQRLQSAGKAVRVATARLVEEASQKAAAYDERILVISDRMVSGIAQVMSAQEEVLRKERELQEARKNLAIINKSRYEKSPEPQL